MICHALSLFIQNPIINLFIYLLFDCELGRSATIPIFGRSCIPQPPLLFFLIVLQSNCLLLLHFSCSTTMSSHIIRSRNDSKNSLSIPPRQVKRRHGFQVPARKQEGSHHVPHPASRIPYPWNRSPSHPQNLSLGETSVNHNTFLYPSNAHPCPCTSSSS